MTHHLLQQIAALHRQVDQNTNLIILLLTTHTLMLIGLMTWFKVRP